ncbi:tRNA (N(6)-L-threonylcarbamoyladenosine(37)-C(2))-methylthiotransferase MtaB [Magnetospira sp. QH-2]|uniref:tRNA (N(6)-L-threonylcarbamoyladenosine(37)-C(2))- methylthiotransferase MtaB n=1 Tax=Magnetospira sp. (strain QH-2) TaxID=1288970 RepID=UPI0003E80AB7|nr:tRNA (N(6)-L-threonylcarbamoyladenosine(37)-C(2))-methylthiotransferase MtaB [Magnetospira sp. QH-2]CCQ72559.1 putative radical SAM enzyme [Magnetospira sp. QH-2]
MAAPARIVTLGCRLNTYESEVMRAHADRASLTRDTVVVNTCAVTGEAERQARQCIRRLRRERPEARIIVTGCAAQLHPEDFAAMPEVDQVLGNREKLEAGAYEEGADDLRVSDIMNDAAIDFPALTTFAERTRAFVQIQQGCDHRCTFCIVPFTRGPARDLSPDEAVERVRSIVESGHREVVLTGVDIASYGPGLGALCQRILSAVPELPRLRLSTVDPAVMDEDLFRLMAEQDRLMPHVHLSLQSGDDTILKRMKRRHSVADALTFARRLRDARPEIVLGADLIAGFPTEDEAMALRTEETVQALDLVWLHVFPYSTRPGTPAARMPQVAKATRKQRAARLRAMGEERAAGHLREKAGRTETLLIEEGRQARCADFTPVELTTEGPVGNLIPVTLRLQDNKLCGELA